MIKTAKQFITEFTKWAESQKEILAVLLVGSYARDDVGGERHLIILAEKIQ
ncbi:hypothetical protein HYU45_03050 [Candidatus Daviesbacteria bacterium]|nr:hypothetical protein [Candidatus Daviesbacteria bacterium]